MTPIISDALYARLQCQAGPRCGYCRTSSKVIGQPLTVEHIIPISRGGSSNEDNLWLSCRRCNEFKGAQVEALDPETGLLVPLFNPRRQSWAAILDRAFCLVRRRHDDHRFDPVWAGYGRCPATEQHEHRRCSFTLG